MTIPTIAQLPFAKSKAPALQLEYNQQQTNSPQARLKDRWKLTPELSLNDYRYRVVIDWIELEFHFQRPTQIQHLQALIQPCLGHNASVTPLSTGAGNIFTSCRVRIQEPERLAKIAEMHRRVAEILPEARRALVSGLEVSLDIYPSEKSNGARRLLLGALLRSIWTDRDVWTEANSRPRVAWGKETNQTKRLSPGPEERSSRLVPEHHVIPFVDATFYLGARGDDVMIRGMDKIIDKQQRDNSHVSLKDDEKRVRFEVRIQGKELTAIGLSTVDSLRKLKLSSLKKRYFQFRLPTFSVISPVTTGTECLKNTREEWRAATFLRAGITGLMARDAESQATAKRQQGAMQAVLASLGKPFNKKPPSQRRAADFTSWEEMNQKADIAFRHLERLENTAWKALDKKTK